MASRRKELNLEPLLRRSAACLAVCKDLSVCDEARRLVDDPTVRRTFARLVLTLAEASEIRADDGCLAELRAVISARMSPDSLLSALFPSFVVHASEWLALRRGAQSGWTFSRAETFETSLREFLLGHPEQPDELKRFHDAVAKTHERTYPPFSRCDRICDQRHPPVCLYRFAAADFVPAFRTMLAAAEASSDEPTWIDIARKAGHEASFKLLGYEAGDTGADPTSSARGRATLCLLQQTWEFDDALTNADVAYRVDLLIPQEEET
jgi:hypothetical protein